MAQLFSNKPMAILLGILLLASALLIRMGHQNVHQVQEYLSLEGSVDTLRGADTLLMKQEVQLKQLALSARQLGAAKAGVNNHLAYSSYLDQICRENEITIVSLPQETSEQVGAYSVSAERFQLSGSFHALLKVLYQIEHKDQIGSIGYTRMETQLIRQGMQKQTILLAEVELRRLGRGEEW